MVEFAGTAMTGVRRDVAHRPGPRQTLVRGKETVGGALVTRPFTLNGERLKSGTVLDAKATMAIPVMNRRALANRGFIEIFPDPTDKGSFYVIDIGLGKFGVVQGHIVSEDIMNAKDARAMAEKYNSASIKAAKKAEPEAEVKKEE